MEAISIIGRKYRLKGRIELQRATKRSEWIRKDKERIRKNRIESGRKYVEVSMPLYSIKLC